MEIFNGLRFNWRYLKNAKLQLGLNFCEMKVRHIVFPKISPKIFEK